MKLDILVIAAHPDDAELSCGGTIIKYTEAGKKVGIIDLTAGELGTRGTPELRIQEANKAAEVMGLAIRENMHFRDGFFLNDKQHQLALIQKIRQYQPEIVLANAIRDRHPDHGQGATLIAKSCFLAGLKKIETQLEGKLQEAWRPKNVYHFIQSNYIEPDFVLDISEQWDKKMEAIRAYQSQFFDPNSKEPETFISTPLFMKLIESRAVEMGQPVGFAYAEGFTTYKRMGIKDLFELY